MRFDLRSPLLAALVLCGCPEEKSSTPPPSRFDAVSTKPPPAEASRFCDKSWPAEGPTAHPWQPPELRPLEGVPSAPAVKGWRWVNAWATWCTPCVEEMALLTRWRSAFEQDGLDVSFELLSVDATEAEPKLKAWLGRGLPGRVSWVKSADEFPDWLEHSLGLDRDSAIPIHLLVDSSNHLRCVRLGAVHAQDYGAVRALLAR